jgi:cystathionine beta-lyase
MAKVAAFLNDHPKVKTVYFVGLKSHPFHEIAKANERFWRNGFFDFVSAASKMPSFLEKLQPFG